MLDDGAAPVALCSPVWLSWTFEVWFRWSWRGCEIMFEDEFELDASATSFNSTLSRKECDTYIACKRINPYLAGIMSLSSWTTSNPSSEWLDSLDIRRCRSRRKNPLRAARMVLWHVSSRSPSPGFAISTPPPKTSLQSTKLPVSIKNAASDSRLFGIPNSSSNVAKADASLSELVTKYSGCPVYKNVNNLLSVRGDTTQCLVLNWNSVARVKAKWRL